ncbi:protein PHYTOCHROME KINASE SUBSTRATE 3-like [Benincasa hispida]|uniref:protein PHYTOCHROME KINASE SUBSTRATE 3-like n=1 Tax=Benincasa hispida TaxID=102211 RepID=UPI0019009E67|nr:protein PHYTOCHROME KINASE SUBSTRATE 3-like [Benincasa hispida]
METECKTHLPNVLISSYLAPNEDKFVQKNPPVKSEQQQLPSAISSNQKASCSKNMKKTTSAEEEIGVFRAERYYGMKLEDDNTRVVENCGSNQAKKKEQRPDVQYRRQKSRSGTSSVTSESSWNSQAALFPSFLRNSSQNIQNKTKGRSLLVNLTCNRSCSDKKSILVHRNLHEQKGLQGNDVRKEATRNEQIPVIMDGRMKFQTATLVKHKPKSSISGGTTREEELVFPISNSQLQNFAKIKDEDPRKSIEVFGSNKLDKKDLVAKNLERKLSVLKWDAIPKAKATQTAPRSDQMIEDIGSDASSDLFEIENISGMNGKPFTRHTSDVIASSLTAYEPSEASIEWSAVTASAADFSSVADYDEKKVTARTKTTVLDKDLQKSHPSGLLGCKSHKAVNIAETAYRNIEKLNSDSRRFPRLDSTMIATNATG